MWGNSHRTHASQHYSKASQLTKSLQNQMQTERAKIAPKLRRDKINTFLKPRVRFICQHFIWQLKVAGEVIE